MRRRRRNHYKFTEKVHSKKGAVAFLIAFAMVILFAVFVFLSFRSREGLSTYYGSAGLFILMVSMGSFVLAVQSMREEDSFRLFPRLAMIFSIAAVFCWCGTYIMGFVL